MFDSELSVRVLIIIIAVVVPVLGGIFLAWADSAYEKKHPIKKKEINPTENDKDTEFSKEYDNAFNNDVFGYSLFKNLIIFTNGIDEKKEIIKNYIGFLDTKTILDFVRSLFFEIGWGSTSGNPDLEDEYTAFLIAIEKRNWGG